MPVQELTTGISLYYETHGSGEPVVLIPGTGFSGNVWEPFQVPALSPFVQAIILDPRGCGRSSAPDIIYTIEQMACDVVALLDHLRLDSAHIIGHSMGGRIAQAMTLSFPKRVRSMILAASGSGPAGRPGQDCVPMLPFYLVRELIEMGFEEFIRHECCQTTTYFTKSYLEEHPDKVRDFYNLVWKHHARLVPYLRLCNARHSWEGTHRLGDISVPTLVAVGEGDTLNSFHVEQAEVMAKRIPKAEFLCLEGEAHGFFWQSPEETNAWVLNWVKRH